MGKFVNKAYTNTVEGLVNGQINKYKNANFTFIDKSPYVVDFYNLSEASTLAPGSRINYSSIGPNSPFKFDYIHDALIYISGGRIEFNVDIGEYGTEATPVEGEAYILPNTFIPQVNSFFTINHASKYYLFVVTGVDPDTMDNGANFYKMQYCLYYLSEDALEKLKKQVVESYEMISDNVGSEFKCIVRKNDYDLINKVEPMLEDIRQFYNSLFFKDNLQTYVFMNDQGKYFYDPYMIEFLIRNGIMFGGDKKGQLYISQAIFLPKTFAIEYDDSFWRCFELQNVEKLHSVNAFGRYIEDPNSLFATRIEDYYYLIYTPEMWFNSFTPLPEEVISNIAENKYYPKDSDNAIYNILTDYMRHPECVISADNLKYLDSIRYAASKELFYLIPLLLFSMEQAIKKLLINI